MRKYIPRVGEKIKLKAMWNYNNSDISMWAWLKVLEIVNDKYVEIEVLNGMHPTGELKKVKLGEVQLPIGWKPVYTITCKDVEQADRVVQDWFKRGINVWASHDLSRSCAGRMAFTPVSPDAEGPVSPHWQYTGNPVETIMPPDCEKFFRVEVLRQWEPKLPPTTEKTARRKAIAAARAEKGVELHFVPDGMGGKMALCERVEVIHEPQEEANA